MTPFVAFRGKTLVMTPVLLTDRFFRTAIQSPKRRLWMEGLGGHGGVEAGRSLLSPRRPRVGLKPQPLQAQRNQVGEKHRISLKSFKNTDGMNQFLPLPALVSPENLRKGMKQEVGPEALSGQGTVTSLTARVGDTADGSLATSSSPEMGQTGRERSRIPQTPLPRLRAFMHKHRGRSTNPLPTAQVGPSPFEVPTLPPCPGVLRTSGTCAT